jgi:clan AA aspartic protease (TIGR02281 family)
MFKVEWICLLIAILAGWGSPAYGQMYKWVDEKGTAHFADDLSKIPERYRPDAEIRKVPKEVSLPENRERPAPLFNNSKVAEPEANANEVPLFRRHELLLAEVTLNGRVKRHFVVDTGASFTLINRQTARELGLVVNERTPFIPIVTASDMIFTPLVTLQSVRVGNAEVENVEALIHNMPSDTAGLLGNSFLNKFRVVLDSIHGKMTLFSMQGKASPDRPGGYNREYWVGQFRFYQRNLSELRKLRTKYEGRGASPELNRVNNSILFFENQLDDLERKASFAGVPRNWRE